MEVGRVRADVAEGRRLEFALLGRIAAYRRVLKKPAIDMARRKAAA